MKQLFLILLMSLIVTAAVAHTYKPRNRYVYGSYAISKLKGDGTVKSDLGIAMTAGKTFFLHRNPIHEKYRIGLDCSFIDLNYAFFDNKTFGVIDSENINQLEVGMQFGLSSWLVPVNGLNVNNYIRYAPTYSTISTGSTSGKDYVGYFMAGISCSYKPISFGIEYRWGRGSYELLPSNEIKLRGFRFYAGVRLW